MLLKDNMLGIGFFRLILAMTVVITHTHSIWGFTLGNPVIAVRTFFIISGFYMSMILREKYTDRKVFWVNRLLKIFPIYWSVLVLTVFSCMGAFWLRGNWGEMHYLVNNLGGLFWWERLMVVGSQLTIWGRNWVMFNSFGGRSGIIFLLVPQAWTLVLELWFYLIAPGLLTKGWRMVVMAGMGSILVRRWLMVSGYGGDLWTYRFFPSELIYFLMGYGSYQIYKGIINYQLSIIKKYGIVFLILAVLVLSTFNFWPGNIFRNEWWFYVLMMILIPLIFVYSRKSLIDRKIGDLSYPVYIVHILVNNVVNPLLLLPLSIDKNWQALVVMIGSIILSLFLNRFIQYPVERIREARVK